MNKEDIHRLVKEARSVGRKALAEPEAKEILKAYSIPVPNYQVVSEVSEAIEKAEVVGYPLVLKVISPDIIHKSDVGGVAVGIQGPEDMEEKWGNIIMNVAENDPTASIEGFLIEEMVPSGVEVIVGAIRDEQFGPAVMFGIGGVAIELMKDVSFALAPLEKEEALAMMKEVKGYPLLTGYRGSKPVDVDSIADVIIKLSRVIEEVEGIKEIEINPLMALGKGVVAVDARAIIERTFL